MRTLEFPTYINWNYTYICNFNCKHCYSRGLDCNELSTDAYKKIAKNIIDYHVFQVNLGGGEPLLRKDIFQIIKILSDKGVKVNLTTNGFLFDEEIASKLKEAGIGTLFISLDDVRESEHDDFRNKIGSHKKVINCINLAKKYKIDVVLSTVVTKKNLGILEKIVNFAKENKLTGIDFKRVRIQGNALKIVKDYALNEKDVNLLVKKIEKFKKHSGLKIFFIYSENGIKGVDEGCPCGRISLALLPNGDLAPCVYNQYVIGNLLKENLAKIWQKSPLLLKLRSKFKCLGEMGAEDLKDYVRSN